MKISLNQLFHQNQSPQIQSHSFLTNINKIKPFSFGMSKQGTDNSALSAIMEISSEGKKKLSRALITNKDEITKQEKQVYDSEKETLMNKRDELLASLDSVKDRINAIKDDTTAIPTKETEKQLIEAQEQLRQLKEEQEKIFQLKEKMAQEIATKAGKQEVEQQMRYGDLYMMKKSFEKEKENEEREKTHSKENIEQKDTTEALKDPFSNSSLAEETSSLNPSDAISNLGNEITRIAFTAETRMDATIDKMAQSYHEKMDYVYGAMDDISMQLDDLYNICKDERYTDEQKEKAISNFTAEATMSLDGVATLRGIAQRIKDNITTVCRERRMGDNHMQIAARYSGNLDQLSDIAEKLDGMQDLLSKLESEQDDQYKEAIEKIDEEKENTPPEQDHEETPGSEDGELIYPNSKGETTQSNI